MSVEVGLSGPIAGLVSARAPNARGRAGCRRLALSPVVRAPTAGSLIDVVELEQRLPAAVRLVGRCATGACRAVVGGDRPEVERRIAIDLALRHSGPDGD